MADWIVGVVIVGATIGAVVVPFLVVPEVLERLGHDPKRLRSRAIVWATFLSIVLAPAVATGFLTTVTNPVDWFLLLAAMAIAVTWDYYRLNPEKSPFVRWKHSR